MPPSGGGQLYPASWDMTTPFPFGCLPAVLWDINPKEMGSLGAMEPAVEDTGGRSVSDRTRPRFFFFGFLSSHDIAQGIQRGKGWWGTRWDTQGKATAVMPDNAARDSLLTWTAVELC